MANSRLILAVLVILMLLALAVAGCMREPEVCNYDAVCAQDETDNCADCKDVLGRDVVDATGNVIYVENNV
ncbi:MAG: hypothetical protein ACP5N3_01945 [Candidatus Nanoarchaeia archaeon]